MRITSPLQRGITLGLMLLVMLRVVVGLFIPLDPIDDPITHERVAEKEGVRAFICIWAVSIGAGILYYRRSDRLAKKAAGNATIPHHQGADEAVHGLIDTKKEERKKEK